MSAHDGGDCTVFKSRINLKIFFFHYSHVLRYIIISIPSESVHLESDPIKLILSKNDLEKKEAQVSVAIDFRCKIPCKRKIGLSLRKQIVSKRNLKD